MGETATNSQVADFDATTVPDTYSALDTVSEPYIFNSSIRTNRFYCIYSLEVSITEAY